MNLKIQFNYTLINLNKKERKYRRNKTKTNGGSQSKGMATWSFIKENNIHVA